MKPFKLEAKHLVPLNETAFQKCTATQLMCELIKQPEIVMDAIENTALRFSLIPPVRRTIRVG